jgi:hypothetical protein
MLDWPVVFLYGALFPVAVFLLPLVLLKRARVPSPTFGAAGGVCLERTNPASGVALAGGVAIESSITVGGVLAARSVAQGGVPALIPTSA